MKKAVVSIQCVCVVIMAAVLAGCSITQAMFAKQGSVEIIKVNRHLHMQSLQADGFAQGGKKLLRTGEEIPVNLLWDEQGEEFIVLWKYYGPVMSEGKPITLHFDYNYMQDDQFYRVSEQYDTVVPGRYEFRFRNFGDNFYNRGEIEHWRVTIQYGDTTLAHNQSVFFEKK